jgi:nucleotidyltransferase/DNA polymerase involved in DNA repair
MREFVKDLEPIQIPFIGKVTASVLKGLNIFKMSDITDPYNAVMLKNVLSSSCFEFINENELGFGR